jgi:hypothetical protein
MFSRNLRLHVVICSFTDGHGKFNLLVLRAMLTLDETDTDATLVPPCPYPMYSGSLRSSPPPLTFYPTTTSKTNDGRNRMGEKQAMVEEEQGAFSFGEAYMNKTRLHFGRG